MRKQSLWSLALFLLLVAAPASAQFDMEDPGDAGNGEGSPPPNHGGGYNSLPVGPSRTEAEVLSAALLIDGVQTAMQTMQERGYIRRADLDHAGATYGIARAVIAYEKPGSLPDQRQPIILVQSRTAYVNGVGAAETQVLGGVIERVGNSVAVWEDPFEQAFIVTSIVSTVTYGSQPECPACPGVIHEYRMAYDYLNTGENPGNGYDPSTRYVFSIVQDRTAMTNLAVNLASGFGTGAAAGSMGGPVSAAVWGLAGMTAAGVAFWFPNPISP